MTQDPYVQHVPTLYGGVGYNGAHNFYKNHFIGKMPKDWKITNVSLTIGKDRGCRLTHKEVLHMIER